MYIYVYVCMCVPGTMKRDEERIEKRVRGRLGEREGEIGVIRT